MTTAHDSVPEEDLTSAFVEHEREVLVFCYRMTGSFMDAQDLTQETLLRAWRSRERFRGDASVRTWLYRIATNACLDFLALHERRAAPTESLQEVLERDARIDPFPDRLLGSGEPDPDPAVLVESRETTELLLVAGLLHLPPRQRIALIARHFLELTAAEAASLLQTSVPSVNSLVQRGRSRVRRLRGASPGADGVDPRTRSLVRRYIQAHHDGDVDALLAMLAEDVRVSMPPEEPCAGRHEVATFFRDIVGAAAPGEWRLVPFIANGRHATANYLRRPGEELFTATSVDVLDFRHGQLSAVNCFLTSGPFKRSGFPPPVAEDHTSDDSPRERPLAAK